jgi:hypothetical protein
LTYNNGAIGNDPIIYIDGKQIAITEEAAPTGTRDSDAAATLNIGNRTADDKTFEGRIAMVRLFTDIRTEVELRTDMFRPFASMSSTHLLAAMYQFDEGTGTSLDDVSANSNVGTITGASAWGAAGAFDGSDAATILIMNGAGKNINYLSGEVIGDLQISSTGTTLNCVDVTDGTDTFTCESVTIDDGKTFTATSGTIICTGENSGSYTWQNNNAGLGKFIHNSGTVKIDFNTPGSNDHSDNRESEFYNFEVDMNSADYNCTIRDVAGNLITFYGDVTVTNGDLLANTVTDDWVFHGLLTTAANGSWNDAGAITGDVTHHGLITNHGTYKIKDGVTVTMNGGIRNLGTFTTP